VVHDTVKMIRFWCPLFKAEKLHELESSIHTFADEGDGTIKSWLE